MLIFAMNKNKDAHEKCKLMEIKIKVCNLGMAFSVVATWLWNEPLESCGWKEQSCNVSQPRQIKDL